MPAFGSEFPWTNNNGFSPLTNDMGQNVTEIGDFNGDGINDFAIADPNLAVSRTLTGSYYTYTNYSIAYTYSGAPYVNATGTYITYTYTNVYSNVGGVAIIFGDGSGHAPQVDLNNLSPSDGFLIEGEGAADLFGSAVAAAGDINGDGYADLVVGAPGVSYGAYSYGYSSGRAYVVFGSAAPVLDGNGVMQASDISSNGNGMTIFGASGMRIGSEVLNVGDFNGDGLDDIGIVARYGGSPYLYSAGPGALYILPGDTLQFQTLNLDFRPPYATVLTNPGQYTYGGGANPLFNPTAFGRSADGANDFNNDGESDVIVGAPYQNVPSIYGGYSYSAGAAYVFFGMSSAQGGTISTETLNGTNGFAFHGDQGGDNAGYSVASLGDINGDGFDDYLIGAPGANTSYVGTYTSQFFGSYYTYTTPGYTYVVPPSFSYVGSNSGLYTYAGSGYGSSYYGYGYSYASYGGNYTLISPSFITYYPPTGYTKFYTNTYVYTNTYNYYNTGQAYVVLGRGTAMPTELDKDDLNSAVFSGSTFGFQIGSNGSEGSGRLGQVVAGVGDVNGDGYNDLVVIDTLYSPSYGPGGAEQRASLIFGSPTDPTSTVMVNELDGSDGYRFIFQTLNNSLQSVDGVDVNGDGFSDIQFGNSSYSSSTYFPQVFAYSGYNGYGYGSYTSIGNGAYTYVGLGNGFYFFASGGYSTYVQAFRPASLFSGGTNTRWAYLDAYDGSQDGEIDVSLFGTNLFIGDTTADEITGTAGDDTIIGLAGNDTLRGTSGDDEIDGGLNNDRLEGGIGEDTLIGGTGNDTLLGGAQNDSIEGGDGSDEIRGNDGVDDLDGGNGLDTLFGGSGNDDLSGGSAADMLYGESGNDTIDGGTANDIIYGGNGLDLILGGSGNDTINGAAQNDNISGQSGSDQIVGGNGNDTVNGGDGTDFITGGQGSDELRGGNNNDTLVGNIGNDTLFGGSGNDSLLAGDSNDTLFGNEGDDTLDGGAGADALFGGFDEDTFRFNNATQIGGLGLAADEIMDFEQGVDVIDLSLIDALTTASGDQAFTFVGTAAHSGAGATLRYANTATDTIVYGDVDANGGGDFGLVINGVFTLQASDFIL